MRLLSTNELYENPDFQSGMVRLGVWGFAVIYVSAGALSERYDIDVNSFFVLFAIYLLFFVSILISVIVRPAWGERRYVTLAMDVSGTTFCIYLTGEGSSPFFILYIWIFVSYGARYGKQHLRTASIMSIFAYAGVITLMGQWQKYFFEASFIMLALVALPTYQHSLMRQLQNARREAERSSRIVGSFFSEMTNEMRGPLVEILEATKELSEHELKAGQFDIVNDINSSASVLDAVISDVLDYYKLKSKQLHLQSAPFDVHVLIIEVCLSVAKSALVEHKELVCSIASGVPRVIVGDEQRLKQVLTNVVRTAITSCLGEELQIRVQIDNSDHEMLLFEIKGIAPLASDEAVTLDDYPLINGQPSVEGDGLYLGSGFTSRMISLVGGEFGSGPRENNVIYWFTLPGKTDGFEAPQVGKKPCLRDKRAFIFESNKVSRDEIVKCCTGQDMIVETVSKLSDLSGKISEAKEREDVDLVIIADSAAGRDLPRIADICAGVFGNDMPLLALSYRRDRLDLAKYGSAVLITKPFLHEQLADAMELVLKGR